MVEFTRRVMSDECGTMSAGHDRTAEPVGTMMTADSFQLAAYSPDEDEIAVVEGAADGWRLTAGLDRRRRD
jgi:hypothetical protein